MSSRYRCFQCDQIVEQGVKHNCAIPPPITPQAPVNPFIQAKPQEDVAAVPTGYRSENFDADEGVITISWPSNLTPQSVEDMQAWVELLMKRIERRANAGEISDKASAILTE